MDTISALYDWVIANGVEIGAGVAAAYALLGAIAHLTKTTADDRIVDLLTKPVSWIISFLTKKPVA